MRMDQRNRMLLSAVMLCAGSMNPAESRAQSVPAQPRAVRAVRAALRAKTCRVRNP